MMMMMKLMMVRAFSSRKSRILVETLKLQKALNKKGIHLKLLLWHLFHFFIFYFCNDYKTLSFPHTHRIEIVAWTFFTPLPCSQKDSRFIRSVRKWNLELFFRQKNRETEKTFNLIQLDESHNSIIYIKFRMIWPGYSWKELARGFRISLYVYMAVYAYATEDKFTFLRLLQILPLLSWILWLPVLVQWETKKG